MSAFGRIEGYAQLAGRVNGVGFEVEGGTMEAMPSGLGGVGGPGAEVVECQLGHGEDVVPLVGGESDMSGREGGEEVIFGRADGALRTVGAVVVGGNVLGTHGGAPCFKKRFEVGGGLVIEDQENDGVFAVRKKIKSARERGYVGAGVPTFHGLQFNVPLVVGDEDVIISPSGREMVLAGEVSGRPLLAGENKGTRGIMGDKLRGWG